MNVLGTETAFEVLAKAKALEAEGRKIIHMEIGEPDFDTPDNIKKAGMDAIRRGYTTYCPSAGLMELRKTVAEQVSESREISVDPEEVVITPGAKPIIFFGILACINPGDEVIYPNPGYPIYESMINYVGGKAVPLPLDEEKDWRFSIDDLKARITKKTKMIVLNSPQNPTGGILTEQDLREIAALAIRHDLWVMSDEAYSAINYTGKHKSIITEPGMKDRTILLDCHSKTYAMTGWRLGYGVVNKKLAQHITRLVTNSVSCTPPFIQCAGIEAINGPQSDTAKMVREFKRRRDIIVKGLNSIPGFTCTNPSGAFYVFPNVKKVNMNCLQLADHLLNEAGVACLSGTCFGENGFGYLRFSYANSVENIRKGLALVKDAVKRIG